MIQSWMVVCATWALTHRYSVVKEMHTCNSSDLCVNILWDLNGQFYWDPSLYDVWDLWIIIWNDKHHQILTLIAYTRACQFKMSTETLTQVLTKIPPRQKELQLELQHVIVVLSYTIVGNRSYYSHLQRITAGKEWYFCLGCLCSLPEPQCWI